MTKTPHSGLIVIAIEQAIATLMCPVRLADAGALRNQDRASRGRNGPQL